MQLLTRPILPQFGRGAGSGRCVRARLAMVSCCLSHLGGKLMMRRIKKGEHHGWRNTRWDGEIHNGIEKWTIEWRNARWHDDVCTMMRSLRFSLWKPHWPYVEAFAVEVGQQAQLLAEVTQITAHPDIERRAHFTHGKCGHDDPVLDDQ